MLGRLTTDLSPWLTSEIVEYLDKVEIRTCADFCDSEPSNLARMTGMTLVQIKQTRNLIMARVEAHQLNGADLFRQRLGKRQLIKTGNAKLDAVFGVRSGEICAIEFDKQISQLANKFLSLLLKNLINETQDHTVLGIDGKRDEWLARSNSVYERFKNELHSVEIDVF